MKTIWKECPRGDVVGQWGSLYVSMNHRGYIVMSRLTYERTGSPKAYLLLFDEANSRIGLKPTNLMAKNAYPAARYGKLVRAYRLIQEYGLVMPETIRFHDAEVNDERILILDLRMAKIPKRSTAHRKNEQKAVN